MFEPVKFARTKLLSEAVAWRFSVKKIFLKDFAKFTGKRLCWTCNMIKEETPA